MHVHFVGLVSLSLVVYLSACQWQISLSAADDPDQAWQNLEPDLDPNHFTLKSVPEIFFGKKLDDKIMIEYRACKEFCYNKYMY